MSKRKTIRAKPDPMTMLLAQLAQLTDRVSQLESDCSEHQRAVAHRAHLDIERERFARIEARDEAIRQHVQSEHARDPVMVVGWSDINSRAAKTVGVIEIAEQIGFVRHGIITNPIYMRRSEWHALEHERPDDFKALVGAGVTAQPCSNFDTLVGAIGVPAHLSAY